MDFDYGTWVADNGLQPIEKLSPRVKANLKRGAKAAGVVGVAAAAGKAGANYGRENANRGHRINQLGADAQGMSATIGRKKQALADATDDKAKRTASRSHDKWKGRVEATVNERARLQKPGLRGHGRMAAGKKP